MGLKGTQIYIFSLSFYLNCFKILQLTVITNYFVWAILQLSELALLADLVA